MCVYAEPYQTSELQFLAQTFNYFCKKLNLR